tara:strand:- start:52 stop:357 length:306 start_codon:yes stop_codon:yes gene_type:complete
MPDPKKKQTKGTAARKKPTQTGYGPQNRPGTFAKKKKVKKKGPNKKVAKPAAGEGARLRMIEREKAKKLAIKKSRLRKMTPPKPKPKKIMPRKTNKTMNKY